MDITTEYEIREFTSPLFFECSDKIRYSPSECTREELIYLVSFLIMESEKGLMLTEKALDHQERMLGYREVISVKK